MSDKHTIKAFRQRFNALADALAECGVRGICSVKNGGDDPVRIWFNGEDSSQNFIVRLEPLTDGTLRLVVIEDEPRRHEFVSDGKLALVQP